MRYLLALGLAVAVYHVFAGSAVQLQPFCPVHGSVQLYELLGR